MSTGSSASATAAMEGTSYNPEKDSVILGGLFQTIINDLRGSSPIWEDFTYKSVKLHASLKTTVVAVGAFLEAFQKVADMATSSKGATREIGSALTRLCMRHRSIESHLKVLTSSILDNLVAPLQDKLEDWKKAVAQIDKDHSRENKKAKQEIKKAASDTIRLQKKVRKGSTHGKSDMQQKLDSAMMDVNSKYHQLEEAEKNSVRTALIEERSRFCLFITCLKPFVDQELKLLTEMSHFNEIMENLCLQASDPSILPASSEQVILDLKGVDTATFNFTQACQQSSPPSSPSSLGSRKSSMCSINSINSSSSGSSHSPSHTIHKQHHHHHHHHAYAQPPPSAVRLTSISSQDSGFTSQDTLFLNTPKSLSLYQGSDTQEHDDCDSTPTTPSDNTPSASSTWDNWPNMPGNHRIDQGRPHTISSTYEKGHVRPALKPDIFEPPQETVEMRLKTMRSQSQNSRESRPSATISKLQPVLPPHCPKPKIKAVAPPMLPPGAQPIYANMSDLAQRGSQPDLSPDDGEPTTPTTPASTSVSLGEACSEGTGPFPLVAAQPEQRMTALEQAIEQMDLCTASLNIGQDQAAGDGQPLTPKSMSTDDLSQEQPTVAGLTADLSLATEDVEDGPRLKIQQNTSLELAKAIRELEVSTAALTSAYDSDTYATVGNHTTVTSSTTAACDTDSYTSKMSLQCSSGYGTMNSTPAGSEDTIASGGVTEGIAESAVYEELEEVVGEDYDVLRDKFESEKYFTIPRSGATRAAYRAALHAQRPASTTGIPVGAMVRKGSMTSQKPPPPVRRTASVSGVPPYLLVSTDKQSPPEGHDPSYAVGGGEGLVESPYAELQVIQQSIHDHTRSQQVNVTAAKLAHYQRSASSGDQPRSAQSDGSFHDAGGGGQFPAPPHHPGATASTIQSLNAKFASLNNQYRDEHGNDVVDGSTHGGSTRSLVQKPVPQVMHKPSKNNFPPPPSATVGHTDQHHHIPPNHGGPSGPFQAGGPQHRMRLPGQHQQIQHQISRQIHQQKQPQQGVYADPNSYQQQYGNVLPAHPEEEFPLPPTQEELQEMEKIYNRQAAAAQAIGAPPGPRPKQMRQVPQSAPTHQLPLQHHQALHQMQPHAQHQMQSHAQHQMQPQMQPHAQHQLQPQMQPHAQHYHPQQHRQQPHQLHQHQLHQPQLHQHQLHQQHQLQQQHHSQQQRHQLHQPQDVQASLMMELKKRVSIDESSEA